MTRFVPFARRRRVASAIILTALAVAAYVLLLVLISLWPPRPLTVLNAHTESIGYTVSSPQLAAFGISGATLITDDNEIECIEGVVFPALGTKISYRRQAGLSLAASLRGESTGVFEASNGEIHQLGEDASIVVDADAECGPLIAAHLPIWGPAKFGEVLRGQPDYLTGPSASLLGGDLAICGRSILGDRLYGVQQITLPAGGYVEAANDLHTEAARDWWGLARLNPDGGFTGAASTAAKRLHVFPPGPSEQPHEISVSAFNQMFGDPLLIWLQLIVVAAVVLIQVFAVLIDLLRE